MYILLKSTGPQINCTGRDLGSLEKKTFDRVDLSIFYSGNWTQPCRTQASQNTDPESGTNQLCYEAEIKRKCLSSIKSLKNEFSTVANHRSTQF